MISKCKINSLSGLKKISYEIKNQFHNLIIIIAAEISEKPYILVMLSDQIVNSKKLDARDVISVLSKHIDGGGGGQPFLATAGGKKLSGLSLVLQEAKKIVLKI